MLQNVLIVEIPCPMSPASGVDIRTIVPDYIMSLYGIDTVHLGERGQYDLNRIKTGNETGWKRLHTHQLTEDGKIESPCWPRYCSIRKNQKCAE